MVQVSFLGFPPSSNFVSLLLYLSSNSKSLLVRILGEKSISKLITYFASTSVRLYFLTVRVLVLLFKAKFLIT